MVHRYDYCEINLLLLYDWTKQTLVLNENIGRWYHATTRLWSRSFHVPQKSHLFIGLLSDILRRVCVDIQFSPTTLFLHRTTRTTPPIVSRQNYNFCLFKAIYLCQTSESLDSVLSNHDLDIEIFNSKVNSLKRKILLNYFE